MILTPQDLQRRHIRREQYVSGDDAFIDVRLPASTPKENVAEPPGFSIEWLRVPAGQSSAAFVLDEPAVLIHAQGPLAVVLNDGDAVLQTALEPWDTLSLPAGCTRRFVDTGAQDAEAPLAVRGDAPKPPRFQPGVVARALAHDCTLDAGGHLARHCLLPPSMAA